MTFVSLPPATPDPTCAERLEAILAATADAIVTIDRRGVIQSVNPAAERIFGYATSEMLGQNVSMLMPAPMSDEHDRHLADHERTRVDKILGVGREVLAVRKDGTVFPASITVNEIPRFGLFTGVVRDVTRYKQLEREVVEIASLEQRRIGQDLHDTLGQELTGLNLMAETLRKNPSDAPRLVERIAEGLRRCHTELRAIMRGLLPVSVDHEGLMASLADLAERTNGDGVVCRFDCPKPVSVADNLTATHLYLIAQEAVHNAVKHAKPSQVRIALAVERDLSLRVVDDGCGIATAGPAKSRGLGLRIMRNRAAILGATLTIEPARPTGTSVVCVLPGDTHGEASETSQGAHRR